VLSAAREDLLQRFDDQLAGYLAVTLFRHLLAKQKLVEEPIEATQQEGERLLVRVGLGEIIARDSGDLRQRCELGRCVEVRWRAVALLAVA